MSSAKGGEEELSTAAWPYTRPQGYERRCAGQMAIAFIEVFCREDSGDQQHYYFERAEHEFFERFASVGLYERDTEVDELSTAAKQDPPRRAPDAVGVPHFPYVQYQSGEIYRRVQVDQSNTDERHCPWEQWEKLRELQRRCCSTDKSKQEKAHQPNSCEKWLDSKQGGPKPGAVPLTIVR